MHFQEVRSRFVTINTYHIIFFIFYLILLVKVDWLDFEEEFQSIIAFLSKRTVNPIFSTS